MYKQPRLFANKIFSWTILSIILLVGGCSASILTSEFPAVIEHTVPTSLDVTWNGVLEVVKLQDGNIVTTEKPSGLIVYSLVQKISGNRIFFNVLLQKSATIQGTTVYMIPLERWGRILAGGMDVNFFKKLDEVLGVVKGA